MNPSDALKRGHLLRDFAVPGDGLLSDFRTRSMLLLVFGEEQEIQPLQREIATRAEDLKDTDVRALIVVRGTGGSLRQDQATVVRDDGSVLSSLTRQNSGQDPGWVVCLTDRFGEIFFAAVGARGDPLPALARLREWSDFAARSCEECFPPEWPVL